MVLVCHMILRDHATKGSSNFIGGTHSRKDIILPSLAAIPTVVLDT